jgi:hypothetical protein
MSATNPSVYNKSIDRDELIGCPLMHDSEIITSCHSIGKSSLFVRIGFLFILFISVKADYWGAIRWAAWTNYSSDYNDTGQVVARVLKPAIWHDRLPWYTFIDPVSGNVTFDCAAPSVMDAEISMAVAAGIDHWAFDVYPDNLDLSAALHAYLNNTSPAKAELYFCLLLQSSWMANGGLTAWPAKVAIYAAHFARPSYRLVLGNRPLIYLFGATENAWGSGGGWADWANALTLLSNASIAAGRGLPYVILQTWNARQGAAFCASVNLAANNKTLISGLSSYALLGATDKGTAWDDFATQGVAFWDSLAATNWDTVPTVAAGWDNRPRNMTPVPWQPITDPAYIVGPTPTQLATFVARAKAWTIANPDANPASVHLLSAWDEFDEGHWIGAVLPEFGGNARLDAIASVLKPAASMP